MRADLDDEMEDQFEMSLEYVSDPVVPIEPPPTMSRAAASEERGSMGLRMRMEEGLIPGGYRYRTRSWTGSLRRGRPRSSGSEPRGRKSAISELETAKSVARSRQSSTAIVVIRGWTWGHVPLLFEVEGMPCVLPPYFFGSRHCYLKKSLF